MFISRWNKDLTKQSLKKGFIQCLYSKTDKTLNIIEDVFLFKSDFFFVCHDFSLSGQQESTRNKKNG